MRIIPNDDSFHSAPNPNPQVETLETVVSTATLPPTDQINVFLAVPPKDWPLALGDAHLHHVRGEEALTDAWRRPDERVVKISRSGRFTGHDRDSAASDPGGVEEKDLEIVWYTAALEYPCSTTTSNLQPLPLHPAPHLIPAVGNSILPWSSVDPPVDLDPFLDELEEFEYGWESVSGDFRSLAQDVTDRPSSPIFSQVELLVSDPSRGGLLRMDTDVTVIDDQSLESDHMPKRDKGKGKWIETGVDVQMEQVRDVDVEESDGQPAGNNLEEFTPVVSVSVNVERVERTPEEEDWTKESKRRKLLWQRLICADERYGRMWSIIPRPHVREPPFSSYVHPSRGPLPNYNLFRSYHLVSHPYHPNLHRYIRRNPKARVHWVIPIHGPVILRDGPSDPLQLSLSSSHDQTSAPIHRPDSHLPIPSSTHMSSTKTFAKDGQNQRTLYRSIPTPSPAILIFPSSQTTATKDPTTSLPHQMLDRTRPLSKDSDVPSFPTPATLYWTPSLLQHVLDEFFLPMQNEGLFGPVSIRLSGPKPDPFLDLIPCRPPKEHACLRSKLSSVHRANAPQDGHIPKSVNSSTNGTDVLKQKGKRKRDSVQDGLDGGSSQSQMADADTSIVSEDQTSQTVERKEDIPPVSVETGDHIRLYCDASISLSLRTWLNGIEVDSTFLQTSSSSLFNPHISDVEAVKEGNTHKRVFDKVRLTLIGEKGEVLIVA
ncbi:hypothetical protein TREMEDRAFT_73644 [Tremella mesenterica DSM 1558]|uniref:uncharacterized protein n=1 Tax=Tremella mesenterica (strain ATCC 24925 / CBS 8224 / DSM 1558 / NBRC 9311 / NRRL Y-6157 / RJB 2259-6 / UBC 559-6) TaxID=578456 RepID=UPI0003F4A33E|nr:uncharacterized protein TREMEDRAFT_73644 [Tremella mesenterica DSM 1558]EIW69875.1 hypothetical protein TREMEDRAFT_73644 [Tremella mesenterica DSM 1558]